ncbi:hypothetical protein IJJ02_01170 [Candidatus Saccharibacteria bacterium]|nr:hypothetical protein [Candidatus Saccharibacteria bacterium]
MKQQKNNSQKIIHRRQVPSIIAGALLLVTLLTGTILTNSAVKADNTKTDSSNVSVTVNSACTMKGGSDGTSDTGNSIYSATIDPGTVAEINGSKLTTICNDPNGYSLYAIGYSNDAYVTPTNTQMIGAYGNINTGTNTTGDNSSWSMKLAAASGVTPPTILNNFDNYHVVPATYTQIAKYTSSTSSGTAAGAAVQAKYQVYISSGQLAGTYTGKVKYTMVHPNNAAAPSTKTIADATYMQEVGSCPATLTTGMVYQLTDNRDNQKYLVARLKDGNCWMLQNLKLGRSTSTLTLTPTNSDVGSNYVLDNKLPSPGKFHAYTIDGVANQNNSTEYYCTGDGTASDWESCYYNWYTATAGTGTTYIATQGQNVNNSICPAGWTLPTQPQFQQLYNQYPSAAEMLVANPTATKENTPTVGQVTNTPGFLLSGNYNTGGAYGLGSNGRYWSRTACSAQLGHYLYVNTSGVYPEDANYKYLGVAVRCVANS